MTEETMETESENKADEDERKLFVGGLPQDAKDSDIREHFGQFGEVDSINLKTDPHTGRSRGFAFVVFKENAGVEAAVALEDHIMKGKKIAVKKAQAKQGKVYVGKLNPEISDDDIKNHFAQFGTIAAVEQPYDKIKNERKNFCFITFEKEETAKKLLKEGTVYINSHELEVKKVTPKSDPRGMMGGFGGPGRGGGRGGGSMGGGPPGGGGWGGYGGGPQWGGYGDYWGSYGGGGGGGGYAPDYYGGWGGYGGGAQAGGNSGGWGGYGGYGAGGKTPRGAANTGNTRGVPRGGRGAMPRGAQRQKPY